MSSRPWLARYDPGVPTEVPDSAQGLYELLASVVHRYPDTPALSYFGREISFWRLKNLCDAFATALYRRDLGPGKRVALLLPNCPQFVIALLGTLRAGAAVLPLSPDIEPARLAALCAALPCHLAVVLDSHQAAVREAVPALPLVVSSLRDYLPPPLKLLYPLRQHPDSPSPTPPAEDADLRFLPLVKRSRPVNFLVGAPTREAVLLVDDEAHPVAAAFTSRALATNARQLAVWPGRVLKRGREKLLAAQPLHSIDGLVGCLGLALVAASTMILTSRVRSEDVMPALITCQPDMLVAPATLFEELTVRTPLPPRRPITRSLRWALCTRGPLSASVRSAFEEHADARLVDAHVSLASGYSHATPMLRTDSDRGWGLPLPGVDCRIDTDGWLEVAGPQIVSSWLPEVPPGHRAPSDGWVATGTRIALDGEGRWAPAEESLLPASEF